MYTIEDGSLTFHSNSARFAYRIALDLREANPCRTIRVTINKQPVAIWEGAR